MSSRKHELLLAQLIDNPVLGLAIADQGFDPRSLERILDAEGPFAGHRPERRDCASGEFFPAG
ncbi:MAG TPA: hypothetical protein VGF07_01010 [Stellaceae bacterium]|jgi:hypothetical protein